MDTTIQITNILNASGFFGILRGVIVVILITYVFYAFVMIRQVDLMNRSFSTPVAGFFKFLAVLHFFAAIVLTILGILAA